MGGQKGGLDLSSKKLKKKHSTLGKAVFHLQSVWADTIQRTWERGEVGTKKRGKNSKLLEAGKQTTGGGACSTETEREKGGHRLLK